jgi:quinol monooxygenase YgiN
MANDAPFGALLQLHAQPGRRDDVLRIVTNYLGTLHDGEPGTTLISLAADPNDDDVIWMWEEFQNVEAVQAHFEHDFFRALQLELADLLIEPAAVRPLAPIARHTSSGVTAE